MADGHSNRAAGATIAGFDYQFDHAIVQILDARASDRFEVEGKEDLDFFGDSSKRAIQVKYHESGKYTGPKGLRDPLVMMLKDFDQADSWQYVLHLRFGSGEVPERLSLGDLRTALVRRDRELGEEVRDHPEWDDALLLEFSKRLTIARGSTFESQQHDVIQRLKMTFSCSEDEARILHLPRARDFVRTKARQSDIAARGVTKPELTSALSVVDRLYGLWHSDKAGAESFLRTQIALLKRMQYSDRKKHRAILLRPKMEELDLVVELCEVLTASYLAGLSNAKPWLLAIDAEKSFMTNLKIRLIRDEIAFNDGYEEISLSTTALRRPPVLHVKANSRISDASYALKVITLGSLSSYSHTGGRVARLIDASGGVPYDLGDSFATQTMHLVDFNQENINRIVGEIL
ncbi:hypothetical protein [Curtobacterium sp. PsM8]|uniref:hypothetical protein n=1 Tax=Curtobacterium sp. PsM8 TaxID=3030532 RepID=UPI00263B3E7A|nr:hypothetical protein [Curtobacterium sp. PsM8]MDN4648971.1 hypothetical protein [Curtobacterium sp. PsM8]